ncbi:Hypothetical predicted protein [Paramuricea clavata]|uniref:Reverse transcriptase zinc-binding domain-containing protein n=1 Tax=Paramuricea clavata TaxID=317549 RepID=A0A7D9E8Q6_PARCT|nr:Hypothetical predicted protein [Paramuricea clavata]
MLHSLAVSTIWHVAKIYPPPREMVDSIQSQIWKFVWSKKPELVRRETCMSNYDHGGLRVNHLDIKSEALLIGRIFRFLDVNHEACPWQALMRYYEARPLVQTRSEVHWNRRFGPRVIWKDIWKEIAHSMNDPVLRDFDWRTVHRILPVNSRMHQWNSRLPSRCARCGALEHLLVDCPKIKDMSLFILNLCDRIDPSVIGLSEKNLFLGCFSQRATKDLLPYIMCVGKFSAWKERVSVQFKKDQKINCATYFNYVRRRLRMEQCFISVETFMSKWCINNVLACVRDDNIQVLI